MTRTCNITLMTKTAPQSGADFGVRAGYLPTAGTVVAGPAWMRVALGGADRNLDALAARSAG